MTVPLPHSLDNLLRHIAAVAPQPWYPSAFAKEAGVPRDSLDQPLERLRLAGLVRLTDWVPNLGQGYVLTPDGTQVVGSPHALAQLGDGFLPARRETSEPTIPLPDRGASAWDRGEAVRDALLRPMDPTVTKVLLAANIIWFFGGLALAVSEGMAANDYLKASGQGFNRILLQEGALLGIPIVEGQWWRLMTCCFVHIGFIHLAVNMYSLYVIGPLTERMWGRWHYLVIYLLAGFGGSCAMVWNNPYTLGAGASGALWGIMTSFGVWVLLNKRYLPPQLTSSWLRSLIIVFVINVGISVAPDLNISASAHFGGGIVGAIASLLAHGQRYGTVALRRLSLLGLVLLPVVLCGWVVWTMNTRPDWIELRFKVEMPRHVHQFGEDVLQTYTEQVKPSLGKPPRNAAKVAQGHAAIQEQRAKLLAYQKELDQTGPFRSSDVEERRQAAKRFVDALLKLCDMADSALDGGPEWQAHDQALAEEIADLRKFLGKP